MKTIFIAIAFGTSIRDVLRNDTFYLLRQRDDLRIVILTKSEQNDDFKNEFGGKNIVFDTLPSFKPTIIERFLYQMQRALLRRRCKTIDLGNTSGDTTIIDLLKPVINFLELLIKEKGIERLIEFGYKKCTPVNYCKDLFAEYKPDLVACTRVLNFSADYPVLRQAVFQKIPVMVLVSSWDNLTSKGFYPFGISRLVVWNDNLKDEANSLFGINRDMIDVTGVPRYDLFFRKSGFRNRETFFKDLKLDPLKKYVLYATGSWTTGRSKFDSTSPEPEIISYISENMDTTENKFGLIVRLHPQANPDEYREIALKPNVYLDVPGKKATFQDRIFQKNDEINFAEMLMHSSVVINLASTITIDAAIFDRPVICINYDFRGYRPFRYSVKRFYNFDHYEKIMQFGGLRLANSGVELLDLIKMYLKNPELDSCGRNAIVQSVCKYTDGYAGKRVAESILKMIGKNN